MSVNVDFGEVAKLAADLHADAAVASGRVEKAVRTSTQTLYNQSVGAAPVLTGELKASISQDVSGLAQRVYATARAGFYQEYGTSVMPPQPFLMVFADEAHADLERQVFQARWGVSA